VTECLFQTDVHREQCFMYALQRSHIDTVIQVAQQQALDDAALAHDAVIRQSWLRCVHDHKLDPTRMQEPIILPQDRYREHQDQIEGLMRVARYGLEALYQQVSGLGYVVLLTDAKGVTVDFIGDLQMDASLRKTGLYLGAVWSEQFAGTNGVGTCLTTGQSLTVHQADHFDAMHIPLTCTAAPIYGPTGTIQAVLDLSAMHSPEQKQSQHFALQLVRIYTHQIENAYFLNQFSDHWILRLAAAPHFLEVHPELLLALNERAEVIGHNRRALEFFQTPTAPSLLGAKLDSVLEIGEADLPNFLFKSAYARQTVSTVFDQRLLFMQVSAPRKTLGSNRQNTLKDASALIPAPLCALSGGDPMLDAQIAHAAKLAPTPVSLLLLGETGCGKEFFAKAIHQSSPRRLKPFVAVNCAAFPEGLIESELFGYAPGSFTGALGKGKIGLIQQADQGSLFLDEIGDMPLSVQVRLLRVFSEQEVLPVGAKQPIKVNIRLISASHRDLSIMVREGSFREDLFYRLAGARLQLPPLRERQDLAWVIQHLFGLYAWTQDARDKPSLGAQTLELLKQHLWPGNLRELRTVIEYACSVAQDAVIQVTDLPDYLRSSLKLNLAPSHLSSLAASQGAITSPERIDLLAALKRRAWNVSLTATDLGLSRMTLYRRMKRLEIAHPKNSL
jgi:transcriptional regulator of acetoin/glycerol metabolism